MKLNREQAEELLDSGGDSALGLSVDFDEQVDSRRWVSIHRFIVRDSEGRFWETHYERGLTEYQDVQPFEDDDEVEFREVEKVPVTTFIYRRI